MKDILDILTSNAVKNSPLFLLVIILAFGLKAFVEKKFDLLNSNIQAVSSTSLSIKESLRDREVDALIEFRENIEEFQHLLISALTNFGNEKVTSESINAFYKNENKLYLDVKKSIAKMGVILRSEEIYLNSDKVLSEIREINNTVIKNNLNQLIDLQTKQEIIEQRFEILKQDFQKQITENPNADPEADKKALTQAKALQTENSDINARLTELMGKVSKETIQAQPKIIDLLVDLKISVSNYVYRPLKSHEINRE